MSCVHAGAVQGCLMPTAQCLFSWLVGVLGDSVRLLDMYHNYPTVVETVLELFVECGRRMLCYLTPVGPWGVLCCLSINMIMNI